MRTLAARLSGKAGAWTADGDTVRSDRTPTVEVTDLHDGQMGPTHVDLRFALDPAQPDGPVIVDCVSGIGGTPEQAAEHAAHMWVETTGSAVLELLTQQGQFADHFQATDPDGLPGFHVVHSPAVAYGFDPGPLRDWLPGNPVLPALRTTLPGHLTAQLNGVKLLFGGTTGDETVEVRVNGDLATDATAALAAMDWPRSDRAAFARMFLLAFGAS